MTKWRGSMGSSPRTAFSMVLFALSGALPGVHGDEAPLQVLRVFPANVQLDGARDRQTLVAQAVHADGTTRDVTADARWTLTNASLARIESAALSPLADGATELHVEFQDQKVVVPVEVRNAAVDPPTSFRLDVMPIFMRAGCNSGACHGAARGKDGFRLSLFGFDPEGDYFRLTREMYGRRLNTARPEASLLLEKVVGSIPHTGGKRFGAEDEPYRTLSRWIAAGAPNDPGAVPAVTEVEILPPEAVLEGVGSTQRLTVRARYSDGSDRDVTSLAYFLTNNETVAKVSPDGAITAGERGEAHVMARFETHTVRMHAIVIPKGLEYVRPELPEKNYIDQLIHEKLAKLRIVPSEVAGDEVFLRRATLDITGRIPTPEEYAKFLESTESDKRERLVDDLLSRKEFVELWVLKWAELLQIRSSQDVSYKSMLLYYNWLQQRVAGNVPMDRLVQEILSAQGGTFENAATNYYQNETDTLKVAENVAQVFMGARIQCAQCHNHPFDRWTQGDYYGFAAFFSQIGRKKGADPRETIVFNRGGGEVNHPVTGQVVKPKFLGGDEPDVPGVDRRKVLAEWLASPRNPYFARNLANIVWAHFFGRGIVHEVDDVRASNPPSNDALLTELGRKFTDYEYDFKRLVRDICTSYAYQRSTTPNETNRLDETNFSRAAVRRIKAEVLLDCISQATDSSDKFPGLPLGARAVQIADGSASNYFLTTFGRAKRESVCSCEVSMDPNLSQALHLLNGDTLARKIAQGKLVERRLSEKKSPQEIQEELTVRCLGRRPTEAEVAALASSIAGDSDVRRVLEDYFWALLNSQEFLFNH